ncbi:hypothetical protein RF11_10022 [Thelohanellus kitauei]|uniref:Uncharacterized protein n=1 Tax=Thelohanellus kitauei TaxID=669202 RepID=A0A0C2J8Z8_THEKT|nr:hypothetical protein RF11_10022 [Thelohanellus kitauei]
MESFFGYLLHEVDKDINEMDLSACWKPIILKGSVRYVIEQTKPLTLSIKILPISFSLNLDHLEEFMNCSQVFHADFYLNISESFSKNKLDFPGFVETHSEKLSTKFKLSI